MACGLVSLARPRILAGQIERLLRAAEDDVEGLRLERIEGGHGAAPVDGAIDAIERAEEMAPVAEAVEVDREVEVVPRLAADVEGRIGHAEPVGAVGVEA